ncbi:hypothetical protein BC827DRAFT_890319 [Russula dissimulans]|nr:hypothetical protein BC827DRAFT_890319 [Russula dissimulans]
MPFDRMSIAEDPWTRHEIEGGRSKQCGSLFVSRMSQKKLQSFSQWQYKNLLFLEALFTRFDITSRSRSALACFVFSPALTRFFSTDKAPKDTLVDASVRLRLGRQAASWIIVETHGAKIGADPWHVCLDDEHRHLKRYTTIVCQTSLSELNGCETPKTVREREQRSRCLSDSQDDWYKLKSEPRNARRIQR